MSEKSWGGFRNQSLVACHYFRIVAQCALCLWLLVLVFVFVFVFVLVFAFVFMFACLCLCLCLCLPHGARCPNNPGVASGIKVWSLVIISARKLDVRNILGWLQASKFGRLQLFLQEG